MREGGEGRRGERLYRRGKSRWEIIPSVKEMGDTFK